MSSVIESCVRRIVSGRESKKAKSTIAGASSAVTVVSVSFAPSETTSPASWSAATISERSICVPR